MSGVIRSTIGRPDLRIQAKTCRRFTDSQAHDRCARSTPFCIVESGIRRAGVAVIRISGPQARVGRRAHRRLGAAAAAPALRRHPRSGERASPSTRRWSPGFPAPASFTGEDQAEFHLHGGRAVRSARCFAALAGIAGLPASRGRRVHPAGVSQWQDRSQPSRRSGRSDDAETEAQRRQALRQIEGGASRVVEGWRERSVRALALVEAASTLPTRMMSAQASGRPWKRRGSWRWRPPWRRRSRQRRGERVREGFRW